MMTGAFRTAAGGRIDRSSRSRFTFDGTAYHGLRGRHAGLGAARQRRPPRRPLVQISPPARHPRRRRGGAERAGRRSTAATGALDAEPARHAGRALRGPRRREPEPLAFARLRRRRSQRPALAALRRRVLLQDLHVAGARAWKRCLRADDPRAPRASASRRREPDPDRYTHRYAHCDVLVIGAGPAGLAAALAACGERRAGDPLRRTGRAGRLAACRAPRHHRRQRAADWAAATLAALARDAERHAPAAHARRSAITPHNFVGLAERVTDHLASPDPDAAARAPVAGARQARSCSRPAPSSGRWSSRTTTGRASCSPAARTSRQPLRREAPGAGAVLFTADDVRLSRPRVDLARAGVTVALIADMRADAGRRRRRSGRAERASRLCRPP